MKIGFVAPLNGIAGGLYVVYQHAHYLKSQGNDVDIIFASDLFGLEVTCFPGFNLKTVSLEAAATANLQYDVLIATLWETYFQMYFLKAEHYLYFCQSDERAFFPNPLSFEVPFVELTYQDQSVGVFAVSRWIQTWLKDEFDMDSEYTPNGIDLALFNTTVEPLEEKKDRLRVLIEGPGHLPFKQVGVALEIANRIPNLEVWLVTSDGVTHPEWKWDRVFHKVPLEKMPPIYRSCDILLKLSTVESFGYPPLEMMACGGVAIVAKNKGTTEYIHHEINALVVEAGDRDGAYHALLRLMQDASLRKSLSQAGLKTAQAMGWKERSPLFEEALNSTLLRLTKEGEHSIRGNTYRLIAEVIRSRREIQNHVDGQIHRTNLEVLKAHRHFDVFSGTVAGLEGTVAGLEGTVARLQTSVAALEGRSAKLESQLYNWRPFKLWKSLRTKMTQKGIE